MVNPFIFILNTFRLLLFLIRIMSPQLWFGLGVLFIVLAVFLGCLRLFGSIGAIRVVALVGVLLVGVRVRVRVRLG